MKIVLVILMFTFVPQIAVASIFDSFKQAMSSITNSVEKMITTVAFDVKETIDCTLLALEHSLSITLFKEYNKRCNGIDNSVSGDITENLTEAVLQMASDHVIEDFSEFESNAKTKMKTICGIPEDELDIDNIRKLLLHNSGRLRIMDEFLKKQLALLPNLNMMYSVLSKDTECSVEEVLNKIKALIDTVKKVHDQKVDDDIEDILKEMLQILNGDNLTAASKETHHLPSDILNVAAVSKPDINIVISEIEKEYDTSTTYVATLADSTKPSFEYDDQDMNIAEDAVTDYDNVDTVINTHDEFIEPMAAEKIPNKSNSNTQDNDDDLDSIVKYLMAQNGNDDEEDSSEEEEEEETESTVNNVVDISSMSGFDVSLPLDLDTGNSEGSYPDDDLMRKVTEILRDQPHTELVMGSLIQ